MIIKKERKKERKKDDSDVVTAVNHDADLFSSWSLSICNPETGITRFRGSRRFLLPFEGERLQHARTS
jgi:hypothetical protein